MEGNKIVETFVGRDDRLVYRSASYSSEGLSADGTGAPPGTSQSAGGADDGFGAGGDDE